MFKFQFIILFAILISTESRTQSSLDSVLTDFKMALKTCPLDIAPLSHQDTLQEFITRHPKLLTDCKNKFTFYKKYAIFLSSKKKYEEAVIIQRDSILPLQQQCLAPSDIAIYITHFNVGQACQYSKQNAIAEKYYLKLVKLMQESDTINRRFSRYYKYIGDFYRWRLNDKKKAALYYERASQSFIEDRKSTAYVRILGGEATSSFDALAYAKAKKKYIDAIEIAKQISNFKKDLLFLLYNQLADTCKLLGQFGEAEKYILKAIKITEDLGSGSITDLLVLKTSHAQILKYSGNYSKALAVLLDVQQSLLLLGDKLSLRSVSGNLENLGDVYLEQENFEEALNHYQEGLAILMSFNSKNNLSNPIIRDNDIIDYEYAQRQLGLKTKPLFAIAKANNSEAHYNATIETVLKYDTLSQLILQKNWEENSHQLRINKANQVYQIGVNSALALYDITKDDKYLSSAHDICSRFKAQLLSRGIDFKKHKKTVLGDSLLQKEKSLLDEIAQAQSEYSKVVISEDKSQIKPAFDKVMDLKAEHDNFLLSHNIGREIDHSAHRHMPTIEELQAGLRDDEAILEYFVADDMIHSFLISKQGISTEQSTLASEDIDAYLTWVSSNAQELAVPAFSAELLKTLFKADTSTIGSLIIIPDQKLLQVPFEALQAAKGKYLIEQFDVSYDYSTVFLNDNTNDSNKHSFMGIASSYTEGDFDLVGLDSISLAPLPYAIKEVEKLKDILGGKTYVNSEATKAKFLQEYKDHSVLHIALHSELNDRFPDQSALIFESDSSDHLLTASEIYNLDINSELTVLSACNTAVGELNLGDGIRSLTRSFIHAGCKSVLTSLWETPDVSTSLIMEDFYKELQAGSDKDVALRKAKLNYINNIQPTYRHPKYWAHLILVGNPSAIAFSNPNPSILKIGLSLLALLCVYLTVRLFRSKR